MIVVIIDWTSIKLCGKIEGEPKERYVVGRVSRNGYAMLGVCDIRVRRYFLIQWWFWIKWIRRNVVQRPIIG